MNIFNRLPSFRNIDEALAVKDEADQVDLAQAKKDRIKFHRESVRNGPIRMVSFTSGQQRRAIARLTATNKRKGRRNQIRHELAVQRAAMAVRGNLQAVGVIAYIGDHQPTEQQTLRAVRWILSRFGKVDEETGRFANDETAIREAMQAALNYYQRAVGLPETLIEFAQAPA